MFDDRFINVLDEGPGADDLTRALDAVFARLARASSSGPFTLYISRNCIFSGTLSALQPPSRVRFDWVFAPGAVVSLGAGSILEIDGEVELTSGLHFGVGAGAMLRLRGPLKGVRPEWFGAVDSADEALRLALAVIVDRFVERREQVPLLASGSYRLLHPLRIELPTTQEAGAMEVRIEGRHPYGDSATPPTFLVDAAAAASTALVAGHGVRLRMRHVALRSDAPPASEEALLRFEGANDGTELERCSFFVSGGVGVRVVSLAIQWTVRTFEPTVLLGKSSTLQERQHTVVALDSITVRDSWFESTAGPTSRPDLIRIEAVSPGCRLSLDRCAFRGPVRAAIAASEGTLLLTSCAFDVDDIQNVQVAADLVLGTLATGSSGTIATGAVHLVETHTRTSSATHLLCDRLNGASDSVVSITGLRHTRPEVSSSSVDFIRWRGPIGGGLLLQGCSIAGRVVLDSPADRIVQIATSLRTPDGSSAAVGDTVTAELPSWAMARP